MDPRQCLIDAADALARGELDLAGDLLGDYRAWRARGGFEPRIPTRPGDPPTAGDGFAGLVGRDLDDAMERPELYGHED